MKKISIRNITKEDGAAAIIEYTIVLPVVFATVFLLIYMGFMQHQKAVLTSATARGAIYAARVAADSNYLDVASPDFSNGASDVSFVDAKQLYTDVDRNPYRNIVSLFVGIDFDKASERGVSVQDAVTKMVANNQIFSNTMPTIEIVNKPGIFQKVTVTATQNYKLPVFLPGFDLPTTVAIESSSEIYVTQTAEFIRNCDLAIDLVRPLIDAAGDKLSELMATVKKVFDKLDFFKNMKE